MEISRDIRAPSKDKFSEIIKNIELYLNSLNINEIEIPYETKIWMAQLR